MDERRWSSGFGVVRAGEIAQLPILMRIGAEDFDRDFNFQGLRHTSKDTAAIQFVDSEKLPTKGEAIVKRGRDSSLRRTTLSRECKGRK
jgi:hypothetical protein